VLGFDFRESVVLSSLQDSTRGEWKTAQVLYSYPRSHKVILEAIPKDETDQARGYRGYIAVDDIQFKVNNRRPLASERENEVTRGAVVPLKAKLYRKRMSLIKEFPFQSGEDCLGHCNFDSGLCRFTNVDDDDFDWQVVSSQSG